jgi:hypothetical protein
MGQSFLKPLFEFLLARYSAARPYTPVDNDRGCYHNTIAQYLVNIIHLLQLHIDPQFHAYLRLTTSFYPGFNRVHTSEYHPSELREMIDQKVPLLRALHKPGRFQHPQMVR